MIKKITSALLILSATSMLCASEVQTGKGTFEMSGGFIGLNQAVTTDITTYSIIENHKNLLSSKYFYSYDLAWYDSDNMVQSQQTVNNYTNTLFNQVSSTPKTPSIDYRI